MGHFFGHIGKSTVSRIAKYCDKFFQDNGGWKGKIVKKKIFVRCDDVDRWHYRHKLNLYSDYYLVLDVDMQQLTFDKYFITVEFSAQYLKKGETSFTFAYRRFGPNSYEDFCDVVTNYDNYRETIDVFNEIAEVNGIKDENSEHTEDASHL